MIEISYIIQNDPKKLSSPYWQVGYRDPNDRYRFVPVNYTHYSKGMAQALAELLNEAVKRIDINDTPKGDSNKLLGVNVFDPNDTSESQKSLDILSTWLSSTERLREHMKGTLVDKVDELKNIIINLCEAVENVDIQKDSLGNWRVFKK